MLSLHGPAKPKLSWLQVLQFEDSVSVHHSSHSLWPFLGCAAPGDSNKFRSVSSANSLSVLRYLEIELWVPVFTGKGCDLATLHPATGRPRCLRPPSILPQLLELLLTGLRVVLLSGKIFLSFLPFFHLRKSGEDFLSIVHTCHLLEGSGKFL